MEAENTGLEELKKTDRIEDSFKNHIERSQAANISYIKDFKGVMSALLVIMVRIEYAHYQYMKLNAKVKVHLQPATPRVCLKSLTIDNCSENQLKIMCKAVISSSKWR